MRQSQPRGPQDLGLNSSTSQRPSGSQYNRNREPRHVRSRKDAYGHLKEPYRDLDNVSEHTEVTEEVKVTKDLSLELEEYQRSQRRQMAKRESSLSPEKISSAGNSPSTPTDVLVMEEALDRYRLKPKAAVSAPYAAGITHQPMPCAVKKSLAPRRPTNQSQKKPNAAAVLRSQKALKEACFAGGGLMEKIAASTRFDTGDSLSPATARSAPMTIAKTSQTMASQTMASRAKTPKTTSPVASPVPLCSPPSRRTSVTSVSSSPHSPILTTERVNPTKLLFHFVAPPQSEGEDSYSDEDIAGHSADMSVPGPAAVTTDSHKPRKHKNKKHKHKKHKRSHKSAHEDSSPPKKKAKHH